MAASAAPGGPAAYAFSPSEALLFEHLGFDFVDLVQEIVDRADAAAGDAVDALEKWAQLEYDGARAWTRPRTSWSLRGWISAAGYLEGRRATWNDASFAPSSAPPRSQGIAQLDTLMQDTVARNFGETFTLYCFENIFAVPAGLDVRLPYQEVGCEGATNDQADHWAPTDKLCQTAADCRICRVPTFRSRRKKKKPSTRNSFSSATS
jgi:hypothetical protein